MYLIITSLITRIQSNIAQVYTENQVSHTNNPVYFNLPHVHVLSNLETQAYGGRSSLLWLHLTFCISRLSKHVLLLMRIFISLCTISVHHCKTHLCMIGGFYVGVRLCINTCTSIGIGITNEHDRGLYYLSSGTLNWGMNLNELSCIDSVLYPMINLCTCKIDSSQMQVELGNIFVGVNQLNEIIYFFNHFHDESFWC